MRAVNRPHALKDLGEGKPTYLLAIFVWGVEMVFCFLVFNLLKGVLRYVWKFGERKIGFLTLRWCLKTLSLSNFV